LSECSVCGTGGWCSIRDIQYYGAADGNADGGIILIHDGGGSRQHSVDFLLQLIPPMQEMGYHFVTIEQLFEYMDTEPQWIPANVRSGSGSGTRVNDWAR
jgi:peptidoglycan/xylan/chitin deacetylase (PgdA/CDA1 family)